MERPPSFYECAVAGCDVAVNGPDSGVLERVSPKGGPFAGMCPEHYRKSGVLELKPEAETIMSYAREQAK